MDVSEAASAAATKMESKSRRLDPIADALVPDLFAYCLLELCNDGQSTQITVVTSRKTHKQTEADRDARAPIARLGKEQHASIPQPPNDSTVIGYRSRYAGAVRLLAWPSVRYWTRWRAREHSPVSLGLR